MLQDLGDTLASYIKPGAPGEARVLICGQREVGKSMLTRKAIDEVRSRYSVLTVTADGWLAGQSLSGSCASWPESWRVRL